MTISEKCFGIIPLKKGNSGWSVFLLLHQKGAFWGFPKGHAEKQESPKDAAVRELFEETRLKIDFFLESPLLRQSYCFYRGKVRVTKEVVFFMGVVLGEAEVDRKEILEGRWVNLKEGRRLISFPDGKALVDKVIECLKDM